MIRRLLTAAGGVAAAMLLAAQAPARPNDASTPVKVDYHVHVHSPAILAIPPAYCNSPGRTGKCDPAFQQALPPRDLLAALDRAGMRRGLVMSTAYLAESPMMVPPLSNAADIVRAANDWTVALARHYPRRLSAFIGINPLTPTALSEIAR
ncbi:hypothetical protein [uncultured Sphingomonas sp.]|uniref:hypothetical protein n=1 Tax=uncultured Sphingomonas sp. TaxID=158754 RepID=UPI0025E3BFAE|nr:hypothetical protein [uncultured Sphingomonas sp.]